MTSEQIKTALEATLMASKYGPTRRSRLAWVLKQAGLGLDEANTFIREAISAKVLAEIGFVWVLMTPCGVELLRNYDSIIVEGIAEQAIQEECKP